MMDDAKLDDLLSDAARHYNVPPEPPLEAIWQDVAERSFQSRWRISHWQLGAVAAAALIVGVVGGRLWGGHGAVAPEPVATVPVRTLPPASSVNDPNHRAMQELLGGTTVLLAALPTDEPNVALDQGVTRESIKLLSRTRLLLDSPVATDPRLRALLQDLELVLAQVARLQAEGHRAELRLIRSAVDDNDLLPRLRSAAADLSLRSN